MTKEDKDSNKNAVRRSRTERKTGRQKHKDSTTKRDRKTKKVRHSRTEMQRLRQSKTDI